MNFRASPFVLAAAVLAGAPAHAEGCVSVEVQNVRPQEGFLMVAAYGDAESYGKTPMARARVPAGEATTRLELCGLSGTSVALSLFQDLDGDGRMARNLMGMPIEPTPPCNAVNSSVF